MIGSNKASSDAPWAEVERRLTAMERRLAGMATPASPGIGTGQVRIEESGHGWSAGDAIGYDGASWAAAAHADVADYVLRGVVVYVIDSDTVMALIGPGARGRITPFAGGSTWETRWLDTSTAGQLNASQGSSEHAWLQVLDATNKAVVLEDPTADTTDAGGNVVSVTQASHGFSVGDYIARTSASGSWSVAEAYKINTYYQRGIVLSVSGNDFTVLTGGYGRLSSTDPGWTGTEQVLYLDYNIDGQLNTSRGDGDVPVAEQYEDSQWVLVYPTYRSRDPSQDSTSTNEAELTKSMGSTTALAGTVAFLCDNSGSYPTVSEHGHFRFEMQYVTSSGAEVVCCGIHIQIDASGGSTYLYPGIICSTVTIYDTSWTTVLTISDGSGTADIQARLAFSSGVPTLKWRYSEGGTAPTTISMGVMWEVPPEAK